MRSGVRCVRVFGAFRVFDAFWVFGAFGCSVRSVRVFDGGLGSAPTFGFDGEDGCGDGGKDAFSGVAHEEAGESGACDGSHDHEVDILLFAEEFGLFFDGVIDKKDVPAFAFCAEECVDLFLGFVFDGLTVGLDSFFSVGFVKSSDGTGIFECVKHIPFGTHECSELIGDLDAVFAGTGEVHRDEDVLKCGCCVVWRNDPDGRWTIAKEAFGGAAVKEAIKGRFIAVKADHQQIIVTLCGGLDQAFAGDPRFDAIIGGYSEFFGGLGDLLEERFGAFADHLVEAFVFAQDFGVCAFDSVKESQCSADFLGVPAGLCDQREISLDDPQLGGKGVVAQGYANKNAFGEGCLLFVHQKVSFGFLAECVSRCLARWFRDMKPEAVVSSVGIRFVLF